MATEEDSENAVISFAVLQACSLPAQVSSLQFTWASYGTLPLRCIFNKILTCCGSMNPNAQQLFHSNAAKGKNFLQLVSVTRCNRITKSYVTFQHKLVQSCALSCLSNIVSLIDNESIAYDLLQSKSLTCLVSSIPCNFLSPADVWRDLFILWSTATDPEIKVQVFID